MSDLYDDEGRNIHDILAGRPVVWAENLKVWLDAETGAQIKYGDRYNRDGVYEWPPKSDASEAAHRLGEAALRAGWPNLTEDQKRILVEAFDNPPLFTYGGVLTEAGRELAAKLKGSRDHGVFAFVTGNEEYSKTLSTQVGGSHYQHDEIQPIQVIQAWRLRFESANVLKYLYRLGKKGDVGKALEDIDKAVHYLQLLRADIELRGI